MVSQSLLWETSIPSEPASLISQLFGPSPTAPKVYLLQCWLGWNGHLQTAVSSCCSNAMELVCARTSSWEQDGNDAVSHALIKSITRD